VFHAGFAENAHGAIRCAHRSWGHSVVAGFADRAWASPSQHSRTDSVQLPARYHGICSGHRKAARVAIACK
jgi:hypothetical protein